MAEVLATIMEVEPVVVTDMSFESPGTQDAQSAPDAVASTFPSANKATTFPARP